MTDKHVTMIRQAAAAGGRIICLQEIFNASYFLRRAIHALV